MPILIEGGKNVSIHESFWNTLTKNNDSLALSQLWLCGINKQTLGSIGDYISEKLPKYEKGNFGTGRGKVGAEINSVVLNDANWSRIGTSIGVNDIYMFTRGISFIGDSLSTSRVGSTQTGAMKGLISEGRGDLTTTNITFLESNISFVDGFLRPWLMLAGHRSLKDQKLRCDIELFALEKWELFEPLRVRKSLILRNAVPVSIDTEEYNYTGDKLIERQVQFAFDRYEIYIHPNIIPYMQDDLTFVIDKLAEINKYEYEKPLSKFELHPYPDKLEDVDGERIKKEIYRKKLIDEKKYPDAKDKRTGSLTDRSPLDSIGRALSSGQGVLNAVRGKASDITTTVAQGLQAFGQDKAANKLIQKNQNFNNKILSPIVNVVGTGQKQVAGIDNIGRAVGYITNESRVDANKIAEMLKEKK
jgi:hypothetical protein